MRFFLKIHFLRFLIGSTDLPTGNTVVAFFHPSTLLDQLEQKETEPQLPYLPAWHTLGCGVLCLPLPLG